MTRRARRAASCGKRDAGTTLIEMLTVVMIMGVMMGIAAVSLVTYRVSSEHRGARDEVVSTLRNASERALSEQRTYCVEISANAWSLYRAACAGASSVPVQTGIALESSQESLSGSFTAPSGHESACGSGACVYFYPRGNSSDGSVTVSRTGRPTYTVDVEGLTSRVSTSG
jgi:type II secretion system protein H